MTDQNRHGARTKPSISRHPLFPAIIALWFGALFGLGSLAVRPSLLEELVIAAQIDALVPAAAPPLGITSRILLALAMALIGGVIGGTIARRIGRPKPVARPRRRGAVVPDAQPRGYVSGRYSHDDDADDYDSEDEVAAHGPNKRRSLAISEVEQPMELQDYAPLPGGAPQILNLADVSAEPIRAKARPDHFAPRLAEEADYFNRAEETPRAQEAIARLERTFSAPAAEEGDLFDGADDGDAMGMNGIDFSAPSPTAARPAFGAPAAPFAAPAPFSAPTPLASPEPTTPAQFAPPAGARFQAPAAVADAPREPIALSPHQPLFASRTEPANPQVAETPAPAHARAEAPVAETPQAVIDAPPAIAAEAPAKAVFAPPIGAAAQKIAGAELDTLSPVQLVERLALSLQRRRKLAKEAVAVAPTADSVAKPVPSAPIQAAMAMISAPMQGAAESASAVVPPPMAMPAALRPVSTHDDFDDDLPEFTLPPRFVAAPPVAQVPAEVPEIAEKAPAATANEPVSEVPATVAGEAASLPEEAGPASDDEARALEDGYSSLLDLSRPATGRQPFVRIEEPVEHGAAIEPVVVFPGQVARMPGLAFAQPAPVAAPAPAPAPVQQHDGVRRFDSPPAATSAARVNNPNAVRTDPEEAERALRSALATLQRMSAAS